MFHMDGNDEGKYFLRKSSPIGLCLTNMEIVDWAPICYWYANVTHSVVSALENLIKLAFPIQFGDFINFLFQYMLGTEEIWHKYFFMKNKLNISTGLPVCKTDYFKFSITINQFWYVFHLLLSKHLTSFLPYQGWSNPNHLK